MVRTENWLRRFGGRLYAMVRVSMGVGAPSLFVMVLMCGWPGGLATVLFQSCWMSRAGGSCGWYCRWRKTVRFVLFDFSLL